MERASYRDVVIPRIRLRSCSALIAPTRILDQTRPYLRQLSFDERDIQYSRATFMRSAENKGTHRLLAQAWIPNGGSLKLRAYYDKPDDDTADIGSQTLTAGSSGLATATFDEVFLDPAYPKKVLPAGCALHISMEYDGTIYDQVAGLEIKEAPFDDDASGSVAITPGAILGAEGLNLFTIPDPLPKPLGGSQLSIWKPKFPVPFDFSPLGYVMFGLRLGSLTHVDDKGLLDKDGWKKTPRESAGKQFDRLCSEQSEAIENVRSMGSSPDGSDKSSSFAHECTKEIKIGGAAQVFADLAYDWDATECPRSRSSMTTPRSCSSRARARRATRPPSPRRTPRPSSASCASTTPTPRATTPLRVSSAISWSPKSSSKYASFSMPCLQAYEDRNSFDRETNSCVIGTCLVSTASTAEDLVKPDATRGLMSLFFEHRRDEAPVVLTKYARIPVRGVTKLVLSPIAFDSTLESCVGAEKPSYRVMALARVEGLFSKPFTLCELEHPVDFVVSLTSSGTTATLLASTIIPARTRPRAVRGSL